MLAFEIAYCTLPLSFVTETNRSAKDKDHRNASRKKALHKTVVATTTGGAENVDSALLV
jgi:hypothetical protein